MPWKETCAMQEKAAFVKDWLSGEFGMSELCRRYRISRVTGYEVVERFKAHGLAGLDERSHARHHQAHATDASAVEALVALKLRHPSWGPVKLKAWLEREQAQQVWPAASTMGELLRRRGLVVPRRRRAHTPPYATPFAHAHAANEVWSIDFKGQFSLGNGQRCYPLTVTDNFSRYLLCCQGMLQPRHGPVQARLERVFREHGLPRSLRSDNGVPFASVAVGGLSRLAIWCIKLGITPERIAPGKPQQNGRHERMHRTLKAEAISPARATLATQQRAFDRFTLAFNVERPHQALGAGRRPSDLYRPSPRHFPDRLPSIEYDTQLQVRKVRNAGQIRWHGQEIYLSKTLTGEPVALKPIDHDCWQVYFGPIYLGVLDPRRGRIKRPDRRHNNL